MSTYRAPSGVTCNVATCNNQAVMLTDEWYCVVHGGSEPTSSSTEVLNGALDILGNRGAIYNNDSQPAMAMTAELWSALLGQTIPTWQADVMMALHKIARMTVRNDIDDPIDGAAYLSLAQAARKERL